MQDARIVKVGLSKKQMSKIRNGHRVRVKPAMHGEGINLIVNPHNYSIISRTFSRNKGVDMSLSPEEIIANQEATDAPEMEGQGIFGKTFDRGVKKIIGKKATKALYDELREYLPQAQAGLTAGLTSGATALALNPTTAWLAPYLPGAVAGLSTLGSSYLEDPSKYQSMAGMVLNPQKRKGAKTLAGRFIQEKALDSLNQELGTNMGNLSRASLESMLANKARSELDSMAVRQSRQTRGLDYQQEDMSSSPSSPYTPSPFSNSYDTYMSQRKYGRGLYAGKGLYTGRRTGGAVGLNAGFVEHRPQALQSQPFDVNFQFRHTLPPSFRVSGSGLGL